jgi:RNA polymerase sigma-70 factor (ECF subfamily)
MTAAGTASPSFEQAILPHLDAAYNLARWLVRDPAMADDIVQDACLRALQYFASFRGDDGRAWLLQIVRNATYAKLKTRRSGVEVALDGMTDDDHREAIEIQDPGPGPEAAYARQEDLAQLDAALAALPVELRECLVLCELEQLSYKQIAHITGVPIGTVMSRLWRARRLLTRSPGGEG